MRRPYLLWSATALVYLFLYVPLVIVVLYSFNDSRLNAEWVGFTLDWYRKLFGNRDMLQAAANSLVIALVSASVATLLGTLAGVALHRFKLRVLPLLVLTPIAIPELLMGVSLVIFFIGLNMSLGMLSVTLAHITFSVGFVALVVQARMSGMDESLTEAARDLGATPWQSFRLVTLPLIMPGIVAGELREDGFRAAHAAHGVEAALAMQKRIRGLDDAFVKRGWPLATDTPEIVTQAQMSTLAKTG